jgi:hypothetical protein
MKNILFVIAFAVMLIVPISGYSQDGGSAGGGSSNRTNSNSNTSLADMRVKRVLDQTDLKYTIDKDGDFRFVFDLPGDRVQVVFINSKTEKYGNFEIREIWSAGYQSDSPFSAAIANRMLVNNFETKLGAWQTARLNGKNVAVFTAKVDASLNATQLEVVLTAVRRIADEMEKEITGRDDF